MRRCHAIRRRDCALIVGVPGLAVLGVAVAQSILTTVDVRFLGLVTLANLVGRGMRGQHIGVASFGVGPIAPEKSAESATPVAGGVVIGGRGAEPLFLLAVTAETEFCQGRDYEKDAVVRHD